MTIAIRKLCQALGAVAIAVASFGCSGSPAAPSQPIASTGTNAGVQHNADHAHDMHGWGAPALGMGGNFAQGDSHLIRQVTQATARFHSTTQATRAGYASTPCVAVPGLGGMGEHWVKMSLVDPVFDPLEPEALLYEPQPNGQYALVGVEYIVVNIGQERPSFGDRLFDVGGAPLPVPHWTLHVWLWRHNRSGLFAPFNPDVSCP